MPQIHINHLTFAYEGSQETLFEDLSLHLDAKESYGLIGRNGRGKSTLLKLMAGILPTTAITKDCETRYFPDEVQDDQAETIEVLRRLYPYSEDYEFMIEAEELALAIEKLYQPFAFLSEGEKMKALLAGAFSHDHDFLLIDEPTNHLDAQGREVLGRYLQKKTGFILVSHDRHLLDLSVDHIIALNKTSITVTKGNYSSWQDHKDKELADELARHKQLEKEIKRLKKASEKTKNWADAVERSKNGTRNSGLRVDRGFIGHKSAKMMQKSKNTQARVTKSINEKQHLLKDLESIETLKLAPLDYGNRPLVEGAHLSLGYGEPLFRQLDFTIKSGDRCVIEGTNGSGKSTIIKTIMGEEHILAGSLKVAAGITIAYVPQNTVLTGLLKDYPQSHRLDPSLFFAILRKMGFPREAFEKDCAQLSAGMKKKVLLAHAFSQSAHLYIFDEPLNFIDLDSRMQIEQLILTYKPTLLFVEHDVTFCEHVATKKIVIS